jgi:arginyl-tRNA synthetase
MTRNIFDYFEDLHAQEIRDSWAARAPRRPHARYDLKLIPRRGAGAGAEDGDGRLRAEGREGASAEGRGDRAWTEDPRALAALERIEREPWVSAVLRDAEGVHVRLDDGWIETVGGLLEAGGSAEATLSDLARGQRYAVQFWDANATKALHIGHLRNLAIGNALASALAQAGAQVERRSLISDAGRAMGEAMAGVMNSGRRAQAWPDGDQKSDHFVGVCYADYVAASRPLAGAQVAEYPDDSLTRELALRGDAADELLRRVLGGEREALELWYRTRAWVIAGQRKTLAHLGVAFDRVYFESDFLQDAAELTAAGLRDGRLKRRADGVVVYATGLEDFEEFPLVRADGLPTQHMRSLAYWMAAPELEQMTSMQVCGTEWVSHVTCRRKLMGELLAPGNGGMHPQHDIFNGMVSAQKRPMASSEGALLIDDLMEWLDAQIDALAKRRWVRRGHPSPERAAAQIALGYFLPYAVAPPLDFEPPKLLHENQSLGWDLVRARARSSRIGAKAARPAEDPDYRFAVVQSELYRRYLRLAVQRLDVAPLAHYLKHFTRWYLERDRGEHVERVVHTLLDRSARGLGLESAA